MTSEALHHSLELIRNVELVRIEKNQNLERPTDQIRSDQGVNISTEVHVRANGGGRGRFIPDEDSSFRN